MATHHHGHSVMINGVEHVQHDLDGEVGLRRLRPISLHDGMKLLGHQRKASAGHGIARGVLAWGWWHVYPSRGEGVNQRTMGGKQDTRRGRRGGVSPRDHHASAVIGGAPRPPPLRPRRGVCEPAQATDARRSGRRQQAASVQGDVPQARGRPARARGPCALPEGPLLHWWTCGVLHRLPGDLE